MADYEILRDELDKKIVAILSSKDRRRKELVDLTTHGGTAVDNHLDWLVKNGFIQKNKEAANKAIYNLSEDLEIPVRPQPFADDEMVQEKLKTINDNIMAESHLPHSTEIPGSEGYGVDGPYTTTGIVDALSDFEEISKTRHGVVANDRNLETLLDILDTIVGHYDLDSYRVLIDRRECIREHIISSKKSFTLPHPFYMPLFSSITHIYSNWLNNVENPRLHTELLQRIGRIVKNCGRMPPEFVDGLFNIVEQVDEQSTVPMFENLVLSGNFSAKNLEAIAFRTYVKKGKTSKLFRSLESMKRQRGDSRKGEIDELIVEIRYKYDYKNWERIKNFDQ
jgi:hypothetical protein